jgi:hypothetical protein
VFVDKLPSRAGYGKLTIEEDSARWEMVVGEGGMLWRIVWGCNARFEWL